jgi:succinyl-CoA synthetase beta subunit
MKLLEHEAKTYLAQAGVPIQASGGVISKPAQLAAALKRAGKGPWVLKAQVLAGGRGKAGGIKLVKTPAEAKAAAKAMLGMTLRNVQTGPQGVVVEQVLVAKAADIKKEAYLAVAMDRRAGRPVLIASAEGGVEIEELAHTRPEKIVREPIDPIEGLHPFQARRVAYALGLPEPGQIAKIAQSLSKLYLKLDANLVEINPLGLTKDGWVAIDAKLSTDDNALFRHPELAARTDLEASALEKEAKKAGLSYIGLDGDIGCMVNGAGLAMGTMDTIVLAGGQPANFLDVGGGATAEQVTRAFQIILKDKKVKTILVNIFGGIMKCDTIANGILAAMKKVKLNVPLVVRLEGTNVKEGKALLDASGLSLISAGTLAEAGKKAVEAASTVGNGGKS